MRILLLLALITIYIMPEAGNALPTCTPTVSISHGTYGGAKHPGVTRIPTNNNLLLPTGKSIEADAQKLIVQGRVVDKNCRPVQQAVVDLWQANPFGHYDLAELEEIVTPNPLFAGAGRAITDGDGYFAFTTGFPGVVSYNTWERYAVKTKKGTLYKRRRVVHRRTPHLNLRIDADGFSPFNTVLFFNGDRRNEEDVIFKKLSDNNKDTVTLEMTAMEDGTLYGSKEIVLIGKSPYQEY